MVSRCPFADKEKMAVLSPREAPSVLDDWMDIQEYQPVNYPLERPLTLAGGGSSR